MSSTPAAADGTVKPFIIIPAARHRRDVSCNNPAVIGHHPAFICFDLIGAIKVAGCFVGPVRLAILGSRYCRSPNVASILENRPTDLRRARRKVQPPINQHVC